MTQHNLVDIRPFQRAQTYISWGNAIGKFLMKYKVYRMRKQAVRELESLNDAQLYDIGIPRYMIRETVAAQITAPAQQTVSKRPAKTQRVARVINVAGEPKKAA